MVESYLFANSILEIFSPLEKASKWFRLFNSIATSYNRLNEGGVAGDSWRFPILRSRVDSGSPLSRLSPRALRWPPLARGPRASSPICWHRSSPSRRVGSNPALAVCLDHYGNDTFLNIETPPNARSPSLSDSATMIPIERDFGIDEFTFETSSDTIHWKKKIRGKLKSWAGFCWWPICNSTLVNCNGTVKKWKTLKNISCELEFVHCFLINFSIAKCKVTFFMKHFSISPIFYEESTLINLGFLIKEDFRYVFLISDLTCSNVCISLICVQSFNSI